MTKLKQDISLVFDLLIWSFKLRNIPIVIGQGLSKTEVDTEMGIRGNTLQILTLVQWWKSSLLILKGMQSI